MLLGRPASRRVPVFAAIAFAASACSGPAKQPPAPSSVPALAAASAQPTVQPSVGPAGDPTWHYEGAEGPEHWGTLSPKSATCGSGRSQSPIDIANPVSGSAAAPLKLQFPPTILRVTQHAHAADVINNGHTIQINYGGTDTLTIANDTYALAQYHFHSPSEHTVNDKHSPMKMHLVHKAADGQLAVVGVFSDVGTHNKAFDPLWASLPKQDGGKDALAGCQFGGRGPAAVGAHVVSLRRLAHHAAVLRTGQLDRHEHADKLIRRADSRFYRANPRQQSGATTAEWRGMMTDTVIIEAK